MSAEWIRAHCLSLPHATETVQWGDNLVFKIAGKMFAIVPLSVGPLAVSFKCGPEEFAELTERPGIVPAPYLARAQWVALEHIDALPRMEIVLLLSASYELIKAKLPKKTLATLETAKPPRSRKRTRE